MDDSEYGFGRAWIFVWNLIFEFKTYILKDSTFRFMVSFFAKHYIFSHGYSALFSSTPQNRLVRMDFAEWAISFLNTVWDFELLCRDDPDGEVF